MHVVRPVLVAGEVLVDLLPVSGHPPGALSLEGRFGGSPANVAIGLSRLGIPVTFAGRLSRGGYGPWLRARLDAEGVSLDAAVEAAEPCTLAVVTLDADGVASYQFYGPDTADWAWSSHELPEPASLAGGAVHSGSLATALSPGGAVLTEWLHALRRQGQVAVSYDPNIRTSLLGHDDLWDRVVAGVIGAAHLVKVSGEDLAAVHPGVAPADVARRWLGGLGTRSGPDIVVVTEGGAGATAWHRDGWHLHRPAPVVDVVDTVGAGDAFTAGLLASLWGSRVLTPEGLAGVDGDTLGRALDQASVVAALTCSRPGADPPRRADLPR